MGAQTFNMQVVNASAGSVALSAVMYWQALQANSGSSAIAFIMQACACARAPRASGGQMFVCTSWRRIRAAKGSIDCACLSGLWRAPPGLRADGDAGA